MYIWTQTTLRKGSEALGRLRCSQETFLCNHSSREAFLIWAKRIAGSQELKWGAGAFFRCCGQLRARRRRCFFRVSSVYSSRHWFSVKGAGEAIWIKPGGKAIGSATWHMENRSSLRQAAQLAAQHKGVFCLFFLLPAWMGAGWQMEIARFTQVHNPHARDISSFHGFWIAQSLALHLYRSPVHQAQKPFLHLCWELYNLWHHSEQAPAWVTAPSISGCWLETQ